MTLTDEIIRNVPVDYQHPDVVALRDTVRMNGLQQRDELIAFITKEIDEINQWLKSNNSTGLDTVKIMSAKVTRLGRLHTWKAWCEQ
jgi:hypothetical protein